MLNKIYQSPVLPFTLIVIGLGNLVWSLLDYLGRINEANYLVAISVPIIVYSIWAFWAVVKSKKNLTFLAQKLEAPVVISFLLICWVILIAQNSFPSPHREVMRYILYCLISGYVVSLGFIKYYELKKDSR